MADTFEMPIQRVAVAVREIKLAEHAMKDTITCDLKVVIDLVLIKHFLKIRALALINHYDPSGHFIFNYNMIETGLINLWYLCSQMAIWLHLNQISLHVNRNTPPLPL